MKRTFEIIGIVASLSVGAYVVSYFACVDAGLRVTMGGRFSAMVMYRLPPFAEGHDWAFFGPIHQLDRLFFRPSKWEGKEPTGRILIFPNP